MNILDPLSGRVVFKGDPEPVSPATAWFPAPHMVNGAYLGVTPTATVPDLQTLSVTSSAPSSAADGRLRYATRWEVPSLPPYPMIARRP